MEKKSLYLALCSQGAMPHQARPQGGIRLGLEEEGVRGKQPYCDSCGKEWVRPRGRLRVFLFLIISALGLEASPL